MNDGRLIGFVPFVFVVVGVVVFLFLFFHIFGDMRRTSVDSDHCARIRFNQIVFACSVLFLICEFKVAPAQCFEFHPFRSPAMPKTMEEPKSMKRPKRAKTARREMTPEQKKARNEARRGTRSTEVEHRRTKQKGKRGVETQRRQASEQARQYTFSQYWYEQGRTVGKRVTKPDILA